MHLKKVVCPNFSFITTKFIFKYKDGVRFKTVAL